MIGSICTPGGAELDKICQQHSVTFKESDIKRRSQGHAYGSKEWDEFHTAARNGVESVNAQIKKGGTADIESAARRRARGIAVAQVFVTIRIVQHNLERIADFLKQRFMKEEGILVRKSEPAIRSRDADWMNPYTKTTGTTNIPVVAPELDQPPLLT